MLAFIKILLYIIAIALIAYGLYKICIDDDKCVGYISFLFSAVTFLITSIPTDANPPRAAQSQVSGSPITDSEDNSDISHAHGEEDSSQKDDSEDANSNSEKNPISTSNSEDAASHSKEEPISGSDPENADSSTSPNDDADALEISCVPLRDVFWLDEIKIHKDVSALTTRGAEWTDCIGFGSSNLNADGNAAIRAVCDCEYSRFTAEIAPQDGFDATEEITFYIYGTAYEGTEEKQIFKETYYISRSTKPIEIDIDISGADNLYLTKTGDYSQARIAGQYINGYSGMGIIMRDAMLHK